MKSLKDISEEIQGLIKAAEVGVDKVAALKPLETAVGLELTKLAELVRIKAASVDVSYNDLVKFRSDYGV